VKRLVVIIIGAVIAGKIFAGAVVRFAEKSDLTSKTLVHRLLLDRVNSDDQMNVSNIPNNLAISKVKPRSFYKHQNFPLIVNTKPVAVVAKAVGKTEEKAIEDKAKEDKKKEEDERRKKRRKTLEEKTNAVADKAKVAPAPLYVPPPVDNTLPIWTTYQAPIPLASPQQNPANPLVTAALTPKTSVGVTALSNSNMASWTSLLVSNPTASLMSAFESLYKTKHITEPEYYSVLTAMEASSNSEARNFSVQAAAIYQNIFSFKILADESVSENNSQIKAQAQSAVKAYAVAADASILQQALASGDPSEILEAKSLGATSVPAVAANTFTAGARN